MSADQPIDGWLDAFGFATAEARQRARQALESAGLTRSGKTRISNEKLPRAKQVLRGQFFLYCSPSCLPLAQASGREPVLCSPKDRCEGCGGSDNRRAEKAVIDAFQKRGLKRLVVVGGSPSVREELERTLGQALELRVIDGTERRTQDRAKADLEWADVVLLWSASELHHKVAWPFLQAPPWAKGKIVHVAKRGIAALMAAALEHLEKK